MAVKNAMTADFLRSAYGGESMAHMRYLHWSEIAQKEGFPNIARLFKAIAYAEQVHAGNHFNVLDGDIGDHSVTAGGVFGVKDRRKPARGIMERHEVEQMYPAYLEVAKKGESCQVFPSLEAERYTPNFTKGQEAAEQGKDFEFKKVYICPVCGHVLDELPDQCRMWSQRYI